MVMVKWKNSGGRRGLRNANIVDILGKRWTSIGKINQVEI